MNTIEQLVKETMEKGELTEEALLELLSLSFELSERFLQENKSIRLSAIMQNTRVTSVGREIQRKLRAEVREKIRAKMKSQEEPEPVEKEQEEKKESKEGGDFTKIFNADFLDNKSLDELRKLASFNGIPTTKKKKSKLYDELKALFLYSDFIKNPK